MLPCPVVALASLLPALALARDARAQGDDPRAIAEALFRSGRELMASGDLAAACPRFAESNRIDPKPGTLMNLALCHEKAGRTASAWAEYAQAAEIASRAGQPERERVARERARALEAALTQVVIDASAEPHATVRLDDQVIGPGALGTPFPVDPGEHVVRATERGKIAFLQTVTVSPSADEVTVRIPTLTDDPSEPRSPPRVDPAALSPIPPVDATTHPARPWGYAVGGIGLGLVAMGSYFGLHALSEKQVANRECDTAMNCTATGLDAISQLKTDEAVSTFTVLGGVAAIATGVYLVLATSRPDARSTSTAMLGEHELHVGPDARSGGVGITWTW